VGIASPMVYSSAASRLRRTFLSDRFFFVTVRLLKRRSEFRDADFRFLTLAFCSLSFEHKPRTFPKKVRATLLSQAWQTAPRLRSPHPSRSAEHPLPLGRARAWCLSKIPRSGTRRLRPFPAQPRCQGAAGEGLRLSE